MSPKKTTKKNIAPKRSSKKTPARKKTAVKKATQKKVTTKSKRPSTKKAAQRKATAKKATATKATTRKQATSRAKAPAKKRVVKRRARPAPPPMPLEERPTEEIWDLYQKARKKTDATAVEQLRNILMERHYPLVKYIAERLLQTLPKSIELDDLVSAGLFGLMDGIRGFDPSRGIKFKTYCTTRIRGSILDQLRTQDWVPRLVRLKAGRIERALQRLTGEYGREPTHAELAASLEMDHAELTREIQSASAKAMYSLSDKWEDHDDDSSMEKVDILEDKKSCDPIGMLNKRDMMAYITRSLTHKERFIIEQYYQVGHTMREIGEMLSLTESRVCQIHSNVMLRLKNLFGLKQATLLM